MYWALFHKTLKTSSRRLIGLCKDVFMFNETEPWSMLSNLLEFSILSSVECSVPYLSLALPHVLVMEISAM